MAYTTFTDALLQAKRRSRLTGQPFSTRDTMNLGSAYMSGAAERTAGERAYALNEKALTGQEKNFADTLAAQKEGQTLTLAQQKWLAERGWEENQALVGEQLATQRDLADKATAASVEQNQARIDAEARIAAGIATQRDKELVAQMEAADRASKNALTGNITTTAGVVGGAALMAPKGTFTGLLGKTVTPPVDPLSGTAGGTTAAGTVAPATLETGAGLEGAAAASELAPAAEVGGATLGTAAASVGTAAGYAAPAVIAAHYGMPKLGEVLGAQPPHDYAENPDRGWYTPMANVTKYEWDRPVEGLIETYLNTTLPDWTGYVFNPGSKIARNLGLGGGGGGCIIVTACTDRHSPEVEITREYRDKFLDADQLRGYYMLASKIVPFIESNNMVKRMVKKWLVERLVDYGAVVLGKKPKMALRSSWIVSRLFLSLIRTVGKMKTQFVRVNGEVY